MKVAKESVLDNCFCLLRKSSASHDIPPTYADTPETAHIDAAKRSCVCLFHGQSTLLYKKTTSIMHTYDPAFVQRLETLHIFRQELMKKLKLQAMWINHPCFFLEIIVKTMPRYLRAGTLCEKYMRIKEVIRNSSVKTALESININGARTEKYGQYVSFGEKKEKPIFVLLLYLINHLIEQLRN